jgi:XRE family transcriptional regulator of biofilm formation
MLGERIRQRREEKGISGAELARRANVSKGYLSTIESSDEGNAPRPSADVLFRIATALGTSAADLLGQEVRRASRRIPPSLREFLKDRDLPEEDVAMLAGIKFRGAQPASAEDWAFLYESIRRSIRPGAS